jgi:hypothetical protein
LLTWLATDEIARQVKGTIVYWSFVASGVALIGYFRYQVIFMMVEWLSEATQQMRVFLGSYCWSRSSVVAFQKVRRYRLNPAVAHLLYMRMAVDIFAIIISPIFAAYASHHFQVSFCYDFLRVILPSFLVQLGCGIFGDIVCIYVAQNYLLRNPVGLWRRVIRLTKRTLDFVDFPLLVTIVFCCIAASVILITDFVVITASVVDTDGA